MTIGMVNNAYNCYGVYLGDKCPKASKPALRNLPPELAMICYVGFNLDSYALVLRHSIITVADGDPPRRIDQTVSIDPLRKALVWCDSVGLEFDPYWMLALGEITE